MTYPPRFPKTLGKIDGVFDVAVELGIASALEVSGRVHWQGFVNVPEIQEVVAARGLVGILLYEFVRILEGFAEAETAEVIIGLEGVTERVHLLMALPAVGFLGRPYQSITQRLVVVFRNDGIDGDRHVGNRTGQQFFAYPFAANNRIRFRVLSMRHQPGRVSEQPFAVGDFPRLDGGVIPVVKRQVEEPGDVASRHEVAAVAAVHIEGGGFLLAFVETGRDSCHGFLE